MERIIGLRKLVFLTLILGGLWFIGTPVWATGTDSGTLIINGLDSGTQTSMTSTNPIIIADTFGDIVVQFWSEVDGNDTRVVAGDSNTYSSTVVLAVYGDTIDPDTRTSNGSIGDTVDYILTIANKGNASDSFRIDISWLSGPDSWSVQLLDFGSSNPLIDSSTGILAEDAETRVVVRVQVSSTATFGDTTEIFVQVRANRGVGGDTDGYTGFNGFIYAGRGDDTTTLLTTVFGPASIRLAKRIFSIDTPAGYNGNMFDVIPGARITYIITYDNDGGDSAAGASFVDYIPANTSFDTAENLGNSPDSNNIVAGNVVIDYDTGLGVFSAQNPGTSAVRIRWRLTNSVGRDNYGINADNYFLAEESLAPDYDAGKFYFSVIVN